MVWATPRKAPIKAYLEFEAQPAANVAYTFNLERQRKKRRPNEKKNVGCIWGYKDHKERAIIRANIGAAMKGAGLERVGFDCSFRNNFKASAKGWSKPERPTLLGPLRSWKYPRDFRSSKV